MDKGLSMKKWIFFPLILAVSLNNARGQCFPDRHNTNWFDGWISCQPAPNPNEAYGESHWILYDFGESYSLGQMHVWNSNDPAHVDYGLNEVNIDFSTDGMEWVHLGQFEFSIANGKSIYEGFEGPDFYGALARYVLITGLSNYGGACYGLSEIRIPVLESPVATTDEANFELACSSNEEGVLLKWAVAGTLKGVQYLLERSPDAENWETIQETKTFELGTGLHSFQYVDRDNLDGSYYYRLISRGPDGQEQYSNPRFCNQQLLEARVYPNPMTSEASLEIRSPGSEEITISISDVFGRVILRRTFWPEALTTSIRLTNLELESGSYFIRVRQGIREYTLKLVRM